MTLSTTDSRFVYNGDASTVEFSFPRKVIEASHLDVYLYDEDDGSFVLQTLNTHYTFAGSGLSNGIYASATITFNTAPGTDKKVVIFRDPTLTQEADFTAETNVLNALNRFADRTEMKLQRLSNRLDRSFRMGEGDYRTDTAAALSGKGGYFVVVNDDEDGFDFDEAVVSSSVTSTGSTTARTLADRFAERRHVKDYGAVWDGATHPLSGYFSTLAAAQVVYPHAVALTDEIDWAATQAAINDLPVNGGTVEVPIGTGLFNRVLNIGDGTSLLASTRQNIMLVGQTVPNGELIADIHATRLKFTGSSGTDAMIRINGPVTCAVIGVTLDCNFLAGGGIWATHAYRSRFQDIYIGKYKETGTILDCHPAHPDTYNGANENIFENFHISEPGSNDCIALQVGNSSYTSGVLGVSRNIFRNFSLKCGNHASGVGLLLRFCDIIQFQNGLIYCGVGAEVALATVLKVLPATGNGNFPQAITFSNVGIIGDSVDNYDIDSSWIIDPDEDGGILFTPFLKADVELATNPVPDYPQLYGFTDEGAVFGKFKYRHTDLHERRSVISATTTAQPGSPAFEDIYIIPTSATGAAWSTFAVGSFAQYRGGQWAEIVPQEGWTAYAEDTNYTWLYNGTSWQYAPGTLIVDEFTGNGTWTKRPGLVAADVLVMGGGGGGGGGARVASGNACSGGGGGGGGNAARRTYEAADLSSTESITIGTAGTAGVGATSDGNAGGNGSVGGNTTFGSNRLIGYGGGGGAGGQLAANSGGGGGGGMFGAGGSSTNSTAGTAGSIGGGAGGSGGASASNTIVRGGSGGAGGTNGAAGSAAGYSTEGSAGGGSGGGIAASPANTAGGVGGTAPGQYTNPAAGSAGAQIGSANASGGGGGGSNAAGVGTAGGAGGTGGGGGGGGGSAVGGNGGAGGAGGAGFVRVINYF